MWTQSDFDAFPEKRMHNLLVIIGGSFLRALQARLGTVSLWTDPYPKVLQHVPRATWLSALRFATVCARLWL